jgi:hypothetical protein
MMQEIADVFPPATRLHRMPSPGATDITLGVLEKRGDPIDPRLPPVLLVHGATLGANLFDVRAVTTLFWRGWHAKAAPFMHSMFAVLGTPSAEES